MEHNIIPYIGGEEEKSEKEPLRLWGKIEDGVIVPATTPVITCQCVRVPVLNGHTAAVFVKFRKKPTKEQLIQKLVEFKGLPQELELPSAPKQFIQYLEEVITIFSVLSLPVQFVAPLCMLISRSELPEGSHYGV